MKTEYREDDADIYQQWCIDNTKMHGPGDPVYLALKLNGEAGEVAEKVAKTVRDHNGEHMRDDRRLAVAIELGDALWYIAVLAKTLGYNLSEVIELNQLKILARHARGTTHGEGDER